MLNIRALHPELASQAIKELNEEPTKIAESIELLRSWIRKQPHLKSREDEQFLLTFLRSSKYSIERAKKKIDYFYTLRTAIPELFKNRDIENSSMLDVLRLGTGLVLPKSLGEFGPRICLIRPGMFDPAKYTIYELLRPATLVADIELVEDDNLIVSGLIEIIDLANVNMNHLLQVDVRFMKRLAAIGADASPLRHVGTHFINTPPTFETVFNIMKSILSSSRTKRVFVHGQDWSSLYAHVPQIYLPKEYGGENGTIGDIISFWENKIHSYKEYFLEDENYGTVEKLRTGDVRYYSENLFGVDGSFRSLNVD